MLSSVSQFFKKTYQDHEFELEMHPKLIYFEKVTPDGAKPHQKCIVNQKIDTNYVRKVLKTDTIPFYEMCITRKATFG